MNFRRINIKLGLRGRNLPGNSKPMRSYVLLSGCDLIGSWMKPARCLTFSFILRNLADW